jgi:hypothetical protein
MGERNMKNSNATLKCIKILGITPILYEEGDYRKIVDKM